MKRREIKNRRDEAGVDLKNKILQYEFTKNR